MKVLVINDQDGHCNAFDISTPEQRTKIYCQMARAFLKYGTGNWTAKQVNCEHGNAFQKAIDTQDANAIKKLMEDIDLHYDRSGGGVLYEVDVPSDFDERLARNMG